MTYINYFTQSSVINIDTKLGFIYSFHMLAEFELPNGCHTKMIPSMFPQRIYCKIISMFLSNNFSFCPASFILSMINTTNQNA